MPDVDSTLCLIVQWKHIIATDSTSAFYQIPLSCDSMKYYEVVTSFQGVRVYAQSAMGMPGPEIALKNFMSWVLGDLLKDGIVAKFTDDLYWAGNSPGELLLNWKKVLQSCIQNDHQPSVHNNTRLGLELWHSKSLPSLHRRSSFVPRTWYCHLKEFIHRSFQGALLHHLRMLYTPCKPWQHCRWLLI